MRTRTSVTDVLRKTDKFQSRKISNICESGTVRKLLF